MKKDATEREQNTIIENKKAGKDWLLRSCPEAYLRYWEFPFTMHDYVLILYHTDRTGSNSIKI